MTDAAFPILSVPDIAATVGFYERLGFVAAYQFPPEGPPEFVAMERGPSSLGIGGVADDGADTFAFWAYVDDVDATLEGLRDAGAPVVAEPEDRPWGERVASTRDPAGNLVHLGAPVR